MKIALIGDLGFFGKYSLKNNKKLFEYFKDVSDILNTCDCVIGNLEVPFAENMKPKGSKSAYLCTSDENIKLLKFLNIQVVNLANNHIYDYGFSGYERTKQILLSNNIEYFGIENKQFYLEDDVTKIAFSGWCCYSTNGLGYNIKNIGVDILNTRKIEEAMEINEKNGFYNILSIHCGEEHINYPNYDHIKIARYLSKKIDYVYYGHHPHVIQGIEKIENSLIAYSLGNFCFDDVYTSKSKDPLIKQNEENKKSYILILDIEKNKLKNYETIPIYCGEDKLEVGHNEILKDLKKYSEYLLLDEIEYVKIRNLKLQEYYSNRKKLRDFNWYIKRFNFNSLKMIYDLRKNKKLYRKNISF